MFNIVVAMKELYTSIQIQNYDVGLRNLDPCLLLKKVKMPSSLKNFEAV